MSLTKPPKDNPHAVFKYGVECGIDQERDRIIALLEQHQCTFIDTEVVECWCGSFNEAVALIKGENK